jgi:hypothetical protein
MQNGAPPATAGAPSIAKMIPITVKVDKNQRICFLR